MADHLEPDLDGDDSSYFQRTVVLENWWIVKCSKEVEGKRFGVAGIEIGGSVDTRAMRVFTSSPIINAFDVFTLQASDGICIILRGFLNKERVVECGFGPEISREFIFGFPPRWESICNDCFEGVPLGADISIGSSITDKASCPILSPCRNTKGNPKDKSTVADTNMAEVNNKDGHSGGSRPRDRITTRSKPKSKSGGKTANDKRKPELNKFQNTTNAEDHGSEGSKIAESIDVDKDECKAIDNEGNERKSDKRKVQNHTHERDQSKESLDKAKSSDLGKEKSDAIDNEVISPTDGCGRKHIGEDNVVIVTSTNTDGESLTSEPKVTAIKHKSLFKDLDKSSKPGKKRTSNKSGKVLKSDDNEADAEFMSHSGNINDKSVEYKRKTDVSKVQRPTTNDGDHGSKGLNRAESNDTEKYERVAINNEVISSVDGCGERLSGTESVSKNATKESLTSEQRKVKPKVMKTSLLSLSKDLNSSSKPTKKGKSKKGEKTLKSSCDVVEPMNHSGAKVEEAEEIFSLEKIKRKIDFDVEVTQDKEVKKQKSNTVSIGSSKPKRSRSGRLLVSSLEFWRNQVPVYDLDRNLIEVREGHESDSTPSKGKGWNSPKPRR